MTKIEAPEKIKRVAYLSVATEVNDDGKLTELPLTFDGEKHLKPKKDDFADPALFFDFRAQGARASAEAFMAAAEKYEAEAVTIRKFGDPVKRKMAKRAAKLRETLAALEAQLAEEGIEV